MLPIERLARWLLSPKCRVCHKVRPRDAEFCSDDCAAYYNDAVSW